MIVAPVVRLTGKEHPMTAVRIATSIIIPILTSSGANILTPSTSQRAFFLQLHISFYQVFDAFQHTNYPIPPSVTKNSPENDRRMT